MLALANDTIPVAAATVTPAGPAYPAAPCATPAESSNVNAEPAPASSKTASKVAK